MRKRTLVWFIGILIAVSVAPVLGNNVSEANESIDKTSPYQGSKSLKKEIAYGTVRLNIATLSLFTAIFNIYKVISAS